MHEALVIGSTEAKKEKKEGVNGDGKSKRKERRKEGRKEGESGKTFVNYAGHGSVPHLGQGLPRIT